MPTKFVHTYIHNLLAISRYLTLPRRRRKRSTPRSWFNHSANGCASWSVKVIRQYQKTAYPIRTSWYCETRYPARLLAQWVKPWTRCRRTLWRRFQCGSPKEQNSIRRVRRASMENQRSEGFRRADELVKHEGVLSRARCWTWQSNCAFVPLIVSLYN